MNALDGERETLIRKNVRLVQSGSFRKNVDNLEKKKINNVDDIVCLNYMGSAEFEGNALAKSIRRMTINKEFYKVFVFEQYKDENGNPLKVYAPDVFFKNVFEIVNRLALNGHGLQEYCSLNKHIQNVEKDEEDTYFDYKDNNDFWWDIENDFFMFFEHTDKLLETMEVLRKMKFGYERNKTKKSLNRLYLRELVRPNITRYIDWQTSIKEYHYDKEANVHYIEFLENSTLEDIFMEAIIIAKTGKGLVVFNINGIPFIIDEDYVSDIIINENGIDLVDSCTYSDRRSLLMSKYNEVIEKSKNKLN